MGSHSIEPDTLVVWPDDPTWFNFDRHHSSLCINASFWLQFICNRKLRFLKQKATLSFETQIWLFVQVVNACVLVLFVSDIVALQMLKTFKKLLVYFYSFFSTAICRYDINQVSLFGSFFWPNTFKEKLWNLNLGLKSTKTRLLRLIETKERYKSDSCSWILGMYVIIDSFRLQFVEKLL